FLCYQKYGVSLWFTACLTVFTRDYGKRKSRRLWHVRATRPLSSLLNYFQMMK
ncbi:hypothetical protein L9F63_003431, partial [Diploptera punctata]